MPNMVGVLCIYEKLESCYSKNCRWCVQCTEMYKIYKTERFEKKIK